jgi:hypothetical protein
VNSRSEEGEKKTTYRDSGDDTAGDEGTDVERGGLDDRANNPDPARENLQGEQGQSEQRKEKWKPATHDGKLASELVSKVRVEERAAEGACSSRNVSVA